MKQRKDLEAELEALKGEHIREMRGRMIPSAKAQKIQRKILELTDRLKEIEREEIDRLALEKTPVDEVLEVIAIPLLSDVLYDLVIGVNAMLRRNGCQETKFAEYAAQIRVASHYLLTTLENSDASLPKLLELDDTLVDAIKKKLMSFIKQRLNITK